MSNVFEDGAILHLLFIEQTLHMSIRYQEVKAIVAQEYYASLPETTI